MADRLQRNAILIELNRPGAFQVDPFFFLIGVTYLLSIVYLATLAVSTIALAALKSLSFSHSPR